MRFDRRSLEACSAAILCVIAMRSGPSLAEPKYGPGVTDTEIKLGQTMPYSGPASSFSTQGKIEAAYFRMINEGGGINGRKVSLLSQDDGYSPPRTVEQTRRLVESDNVLAMVGMVGTATSLAVQRYLNTKKVPQLLVLSGASKWNDPVRYPWSTSIYLPYQAEARAYGKFILSQKPDAKIGILYQNDDGGKDFLIGLKDALGGKAASMIVGEISYEVSAPTVESQIILLKASGANVFVNLATPKFAAQAIRRVHEIGWTPLHIVSSFSSSIGTVLKPAGIENAVGLISGQVIKTASDPAWKSDKGVGQYRAFIKEWIPEVDPDDSGAAVGYNVASLLAYILRQCGDDLTREKILKVATTLQDVDLPMLIPGIRINTSPTNYQPFKKLQMQRFDGSSWTRVGEPIDTE